LVIPVPWSKRFCTSNVYKIGVMLVDLDKPWIIKSYSREPILSPENIYERVGMSRMLYSPMAGLLKKMEM